MDIDDLLLLLTIMDSEPAFKSTRKLIDDKFTSILDEIYNIIEFKDKEHLVEKAKYIMKRDNFDYVSVLDDDYPELLRKIPDYPIGLFVKGNRKLLNKKHVSIVGTRKPTYDGKKICDMVAKHLKDEDITIVSGLAFGIDITAHAAAMKYSIPTISVLPSSVNRPVPRTNIKVAKEILNSGGLLVSEKPPGYEVQNHSYVQRNRIISGMSDRTLIVEAAIRSGSLTTAKYALEQSRFVYAVPGSITNPVAEGTNLLIKQGAIPVTCGEDFYHIDVQKVDKMDEKFKDNSIVQYLEKNGATELEEIFSEVEMDFSDLQVSLMELELEGVIVRSSNKIYLN